MASAPAYATLHLNITGDVDGFEKELDTKLKTIANHLGDKFQKQFADAFEHGLPEDLTKAVKEAGAKAAKAAPPVKVNVELDDAKLQAGLRKIAAQDRRLDVTAQLDDAKLQAEMAKLERAHYSAELDLDLRSQKATAELDLITSKAYAVEAKVDLDDARARAELGVLAAKKIQIEAKVDLDSAIAEAKLVRLSSETDNVGNSSARTIPQISGMVLALASIGPIAIPAILAAVGAIGALSIGIAGLGAAVGVGALAFSGIGDALKEHTKNVDNAKQRTAQLTSAQDSLKSATSSLAGAQASLKNTIASASASNANSIRAVKSAEQDLADAQRSARGAQVDLTLARKEAARQLEDLNSQLTNGVLDQRQATLDLQEAQAELAKVQSNKTSTELARQEALLRVDKARQSLADTNRRQKNLKSDVAVANKKGIEGSDPVVAARLGIVAANKKVQDSEAKLAAARQAQTNQARQNAFSIAQAERGVAQAADAVAKAHQGVATAGAIETTAYDKLSTSAQKFVDKLIGMQGILTKLKATAAGGLFPGLTKALDIFQGSGLGGKVNSLVSVVAKAMGDVAVSFAKAFSGKEAGKFLDFMISTLPSVIKLMGDMAISFGKIVGNVLMAAGPAGITLMKDFRDLLDRLQKWTSSKKGQESLKSFFQRAIPAVKAVAGLAGSIVLLLSSLGTSQGFVDFVNRLKDMVDAVRRFNEQHPDKMRKIIWGIFGALLAWKALGFLTNLIFGISRAVTALGIAFEFLAANPVVVILGALVLIGIGLFVLYKKWDWFHQIVDKVIHALATAATWLWKNAIKPAFEGIAAVAVWLWEKAIKPSINAIAKIFTWLYTNVIHPYWTLVKIAIQVGWVAIQIAFGLFRLEIKAMGAIFKWLYDKIIKPVWTYFIKPMLEDLGNFVKDKVAPAFKVGISAIAKAWQGLKDLIKKPVEFIVKTVINKGIIGPYNMLAKKFGVNTVDEIKLPASWDAKPAATAPPQGVSIGNLTHHASGGILPGYTPGRDVHDFYSATAGGLSLSGGEAIMRPEWVRAVGADYVHQANAAAANGGFALGGIWNKVKRKAGSALSGVKDIASNANPTKLISGVVNQLVGLMPGKDSDFGHILANSVKNLVGGAVDKIKGFVGFGGSGAGGGGAIAGGKVNVGGSGVQRWAGLVSQVLSQLGAPSSALSAVLTRIRIESGGNPNAINLWDSNAKAGHPSQGLMQTIPGTFNAYAGPYRGRGITDPLASIYAGVNYAMHRYGSNWINIMTRSGGYDQGGWLPPGKTLVENNTGKPEAILNPAQWKALIAGKSGGGGDTHINVRSLDDRKIAKEIVHQKQIYDLRDSITGY